jgi:hypothetical protein
VKTERFLRPPQAAEFLREKFGFGAVRSLAKLRVKGGGPRYRKLLSRLVVYTQEDLDDWARARLSAPKRSTSDTDACPESDESSSPNKSSRPHNPLAETLAK